MDFFTRETHIRFMAARTPAMVISLIFIVLSIVALATRGLNFGIDFTGGTILEVKYAQSADLAQVRGSLAEAGFDDAVVQFFGTTRDVLIRIPPREGVASAKLADDIMGVLRRAEGGVEMQRQEYVGPQVGDELANDGGLAVLYALIGILIYVALRFEYRFAAGSVVALVHDVILTLGFFSILQLQFDLTVLAAVLAVIGYSLNDTIVVFDRIRENFRKMRKGAPAEVVDASINQTLSRTLMTSFTTLIVLVALLFFGGELLQGFSMALIIGILVGTYSSIYVASAAALAMGVSKEDLMPVKKEGEEGEGENLP